MKLNIVERLKNIEMTKSLLLSVLITVLFVIIILVYFIDFKKDWVHYQEKYKEIAYQKAATDEERMLIEEFDIGIKQVIIEPLDRVDRCITCHVAIDKEGFEDLNQPLRSHPGRYLEFHPVDDYGCTICHGGLGMATKATSAHGKPKNDGSLHPMYRGVFVQSSCGRCHDEQSYTETSVLGIGKRLYELYGCNVCHRKYRSGGTAGPDLTNVGAKKYDEVDWGDYDGEKDIIDWFINHFKDPSYYYESDMLDYNMNKDNAVALTVYMLSLVPEEIPAEYICPCKKEKN